MQCLLGGVTPVATRLGAIRRASGWFACLCTAATALVASALPTPPFWEPSSLPASNVADGMVVVGNIAGLGAGWTGIPRPLFATFEQGPVEAGPVAAGADSNQTGDDAAGLPDSQLEFVTIGGVAYHTGLGADPSTCGPAEGAQPCVAIYDGLLEAALAWANEAHYLVN